jgi:hypothetical protein
LTILLVLFLNYKTATGVPLFLMYLLTGIITVFSGLHYVYRGKRVVSEGAATA